MHTHLSTTVALATALVLGCGGGSQGPERDSSVNADGPATLGDGARQPDGASCGSGRIRCGTLCVDPTTDAANCGGCGKPCGAEQVCTKAKCEGLPTTCPPTGCPHGSYCDLGQNRCMLGCLDDGGCDGGLICEGRKCIVGCRTDQVCSEAQLCSSTFQCVACPAMRGNCDRKAQDGCETDLLTAKAHCGGCGKPCGTGRDCVNAKCQCAGATVDCSGACVDTKTDAAHCGGCGKPCSDPTNGKGICVSSSCGVSCQGGYHPCQLTCASNSSVATCGTLCTPCTVPANGQATCDGTSCGVTCNTGHVACGSACCENCKTAGCTGLKWCNQTTGLCEVGCEHHSQCQAGYFCYLSKHECAKTVDNSCPTGYTYVGMCSSGQSFCIHSGLPSGTKQVFAQPCPAGTTERGSYYCSDVTRVCVPDV